ncbi:hypothetical protein [Rathayibacter sp. AY1C5]|uniref:hypothetical protein n=1 Tax=Rathayibacter sp. AY1C5 TaxID=2080538 RepID=UPI0011B07518|nr:hypothetical protein [Rathayibacter sp. AY1C5]
MMITEHWTAHEVAGSENLLGSLLYSSDITTDQFVEMPTTVPDQRFFHWTERPLTREHRWLQLKDHISRGQAITVSQSIPLSMMTQSSDMLTISLAAVAQRSVSLEFEDLEGAVSALVLGNARKIAIALYASLGATAATPTENGTISLEWEPIEGRFATLEVGRSAFGLLVSVDGKPALMQNGGIDDAVTYGPAIREKLQLSAHGAPSFSSYFA